MQPLVVIPDAPDAADRAAILDALVAFNDAAHGPAGYENVAVLLKHPETGATVGGLWGWIVYDWLFVNLLFVPPELRGQGLGSQLMRAVEDKALLASAAPASGSIPSRSRRRASIAASAMSSSANCRTIRAAIAAISSGRSCRCRPEAPAGRPAFS